MLRSDPDPVRVRVCVRQAADRQAERGGKVELFQKFPRRASILHMPLVTTLYYSCFYHYGEAEVSLAPPTSGNAPYAPGAQL